MTGSMVERAMRAYNPEGWAWFDRADDTHPAKPIFRANEEKRMRAAIAEMREPTQQMLDAVCSDNPYAMITAHDGPVREVWREMIDIAMAQAIEN